MLMFDKLKKSFKSLLVPSFTSLESTEECLSSEAQPPVACVSPQSSVPSLFSVENNRLDKPISFEVGTKSLFYQRPNLSHQQYENVYRTNFAQVLSEVDQPTIDLPDNRSDISDCSLSTSGVSSLLPNNDRLEFDNTHSSKPYNRYKSTSSTLWTSVDRGKRRYEDDAFSLDSKRARTFNVGHNESQRQSTYYPGRTVYGGNASVRKNKYLSTVNSSLTHQVQAVPLHLDVEVSSRRTGSPLIMSTTAKKILETLDSISTPLSEARRIPLDSNLSQNSFMSSKTTTIHYAPYRMGYKRRKFVPTSQNVSVLPTIVSSAVGGKMVRPKTIHSERHAVSRTGNCDSESTETPDFSGVPKLVLQKPLTSLSVQKQFVAITGEDSEFTFSQPIFKNICSPPKNTQMKFSFAMPEPLYEGFLKSSVKDVLSNLSCSAKSNPTAVASKPSQWQCDTCLVYNADSFQSCQCCQTGRSSRSVVLPKVPIVSSNNLPISGPPANAEWRCHICSCTSPATATACIVCQERRIVASSSKPVATLPSSSTTSSVFSTPSTPKTRCPSCSTDNELSLEYCQSCQGFLKSKPTVVTQDSSRGFDDFLKRIQQAKTWRCDTCLVENKDSIDKCMSCETVRPGTTAKQSLFPFVKSSGLASSTSTSTVSSFVFGVASNTSQSVSNAPLIPGFGNAATKSSSSSATTVTFGVPSTASSVSAPVVFGGFGASANSSSKSLPSSVAFGVSTTSQYASVVFGTSTATSITSFGTTAAFSVSPAPQSVTSATTPQTTQSTMPTFGLFNSNTGSSTSTALDSTTQQSASLFGNLATSTSASLFSSVKFTTAVSSSDSFKLLPTSSAPASFSLSQSSTPSITSFSFNANKSVEPNNGSLFIKPTAGQDSITKPPAGSPSKATAAVTPFSSGIAPFKPQATATIFGAMSDSMSMPSSAFGQSVTTTTAPTFAFGAGNSALPSMFNSSSSGPAFGNMSAFSQRPSSSVDLDAAPAKMSMGGAPNSLPSFSFNTQAASSFNFGGVSSTPGAGSNGGLFTFGNNTGSSSSKPPTANLSAAPVESSNPFSISSSSDKSDRKIRQAKRRIPIAK